MGVQVKDLAWMATVAAHTSVCDVAGVAWKQTHESAQY